MINQWKTALYLIRNEYLKSNQPHTLQSELNMSLLCAELLSNGALVMTCRLAWEQQRGCGGKREIWP